MSKAKGSNSATKRVTRAETVASGDATASIKQNGTIVYRKVSQ